MKTLLVCLALLGAMAAQSDTDPVLPLKNPGFEQGSLGWTDDKGSSEVVTEAARVGTGGLRVRDDNEIDYVRVISRAVRVTPGTKYKLSFSARQVTGHGVNGILWFLDDEGELIKSEDGSRLWVGPPEDDNREWQEFSVTGVAPENAVSAEVYVQSNRLAVGVVDFDEFKLEKVD